MKYRYYLLLAVTILFAACSGNNKPVDLAAQTKKNCRQVPVWYRFGKSIINISYVARAAYPL